MQPTFKRVATAAGLTLDILRECWPFFLAVGVIGFLAGSLLGLMLLFTPEPA